MATPMSCLRGRVEDTIAGHLTKVYSYKRSSSPATENNSESNVNQKVIEQPNQSNYMRKLNARIYIPPTIVKKPRKLEHWKT